MEAFASSDPLGVISRNLLRIGCVVSSFSRYVCICCSGRPAILVLDSTSMGACASVVYPLNRTYLHTKVPAPRNVCCTSRQPFLGRSSECHFLLKPQALLKSQRSSELRRETPKCKPKSEPVSMHPLSATTVSLSFPAW